MATTNLRIPTALHKALQAHIEGQRAADPGASQNSFILQAIMEKLEREKSKAAAALVAATQE